MVQYDASGDQHYDTISAFIKSVRGSDPDAALYWLAKMLYAGEDPRFIARRLVILASEDVGNADPQALPWRWPPSRPWNSSGLPEGRIPLAQATVYLACAPKSNAAYMGLENATGDVKNGNRKGSAHPLEGRPLSRIQGPGTRGGLPIRPRLSRPLRETGICPQPGRYYIPTNTWIRGQDQRLGWSTSRNWKSPGTNPGETKNEPIRPEPLDEEKTRLREKLKNIRNQVDSDFAEAASQGVWNIFQGFRNSKKPRVSAPSLQSLAKSTLTPSWKGSWDRGKNSACPAFPRTKVISSISRSRT